MKSSYHVLSMASAPGFFFSKTYVIFWESKGVGTFSSDNLVFADFPVLLQPRALLHALSTVVSILGQPLKLLCSILNNLTAEAVSWCLDGLAPLFSCLGYGV